jgi:hypothetical protein
MPQAVDMDILPFRVHEGGRLTAPDADPLTISKLESLLAMARAGEVTSVAMVYTTENSVAMDTTCQCVGDLERVSGWLPVLQAEITELLREALDEAQDEDDDHSA